EEIAGEHGYRYTARGPWPVLDPVEVQDEQMRFAPAWKPAYVLAETVARDYPAFLRGEVSGEDVLFAPRRLRLWIDYFSNDNGLYAVNNAVGAVAGERWPPPSPAGPVDLGGAARVGRRSWQRSPGAARPPARGWTPGRDRPVPVHGVRAGLPSPW